MRRVIFESPTTVDASAALLKFRSPKQLGEFDPESAANLGEIDNGDVVLGTLYSRNVGSIHARLVRELFLGNANLPANLPDGFSERDQRGVIRIAG